MKNFLLVLFLFLTFLESAFLRGQDCGNIDFEEASTQGWFLFDGSVNNSGANLTPVGSTEQIAVTEIADGNDSVAALCGIALPRVNPFTGNYSVQLGDPQSGAKAAAMQFNIQVNENTTNFQYYFAVILEDPNHQFQEQPRFEVRVRDNQNNVLNCSYFDYRAGPNLPGFINCSNVRILPWRSAGIDLSPFIGESVNIEFLSTDCTQGGHFGYAYVDADCSELNFRNSPVQGLCAGEVTDSLEIIAPDGFAGYLWENGATTQSTTFYNVTEDQVFECELFYINGCSTPFEKRLDPVPLLVMPDTLEITTCPYGLFDLPFPAQNYSQFTYQGNGFLNPQISGIIPIDGNTGTYFYGEGLQNCYLDSTLLLFNFLPKPLAQFSYNTSFELGLLNRVDLDARKSQGAEIYEWRFPGDNQVYDGAEISVFKDFKLGRQYVQLLVRDNNDCYDTLTQQLIAPKINRIYVPNALTPDGDGNNDFFWIQGFNLDRSKTVYRIYNRWGEKIFEANATRAWDAVYQQNLVEIESYVFEIDAVFLDGAVEYHQGKLIVLR
ncbi:MAG: gliding motility-associated C-terminal domain-containing protein [Luteibaculum sp.]